VHELIDFEDLKKSSAPLGVYDPLLPDRRLKCGEFPFSATKVLQSQSLSLLKNGLNILSKPRQLPDGASRGNPCPTREVIGNGASRCDAWVVRNVEALPRGAKRNHFDMAVITSRSATRWLSYPAIAQVNKHTSERSAMR
jgi:hypothetical protein